MLDIMPSPRLVTHEWRTHGTCSGHDAKEYFEDARDAYQSVKIPQQYKQPKAQILANPAQMRKQFVQANPKFTEESIAVLCSGRYLQEVRVCLTKDFDPRPCNREVLRDQCKLDEIILRPVR